MIVEPYHDALRGEWDALVRTSFNGTLLHTRRFLSYHGDRFEDRSLLLRDDDGRCAGVLPAAVSPSEGAIVVSHPGATYGGLVHGRRLTGGQMVQAFAVIREAYRSQGFTRLVYKVVPAIFHTVPSEDDRYALFRAGATRTRCDLSAAVNLAHRPPISARRARHLAGLERLGITLRCDLDCLDAYWRMVAANLAERHGRTPVHTVSEMRELARRFPEDIVLVTAHVETELVAGAMLFKSRRVVHTQYLASSAHGRGIGALDYVVEACIRSAANENRSYISFGISTEQDPFVLNDGLHAFKIKFGAGAIVHETYSVPL